MINVDVPCYLYILSVCVTQNKKKKSTVFHKRVERDTDKNRQNDKERGNEKDYDGPWVGKGERRFFTRPWLSLCTI